MVNKKIIDTLFKNGFSFVINPIRTIWMETELIPDTFVQILIVVPKKKLSGAADRNLIRRRMREAYRKNKNTLYKYIVKSHKQLALALVFTGDKVMGYKEIEDKIILSITRLKEKYELAL